MKKLSLAHFGGVGLSLAIAAYAAAACGPVIVPVGDAGGGTSPGGSAASAGSKAIGGSGGSTTVCNGACTAIGCGPGFVAATQPGQCCPICIPDGSGGSTTVCNGACTAIGCGAGFVATTKPGDCCPSCVPDGSGGNGGGVTVCNVACTAIACGAGFVQTTKPGDCCPSCMPSQMCTTNADCPQLGAPCRKCDDGSVACPSDDCVKGICSLNIPSCPSDGGTGDACMVGQQNYTALRMQLLAQPGVLDCKVDTDCELLQGGACALNYCTSTAVNTNAAMAINAKLDASAADSCVTCKAIIPPCAAQPQAFCLNGQCVAGGGVAM